TVRRKRQRAELFRLRFPKGAQEGSGLCVPKGQALIRPTGDQSTVRGKNGPPRWAGGERARRARGRQIMHVNAIAAHRGFDQVAAVRGVAQGVDLRTPFLQPPRLLLLVHVPPARRVVVADRDELPPVRSERQCFDGGLVPLQIAWSAKRRAL